MKRIVFLISIALFQIAAYAQRGRVQPEWDIESSHSYHSVDDDFYSFLLIIGVIVVVFIYGMIKGSSKKNTQGWDDDTSRDSLNNSNTKDIADDLIAEDDDVNVEEEELDEDTSNEWTPFGEVYSLKDIWDGLTYPDEDKYEQIDGDVAEVFAIESDEGNYFLRIKIPFKDGSYVELKLSPLSELEEGDKVDICTIVGQEFHKKGHASIIRYDGGLYLSTKVKKEDLANAWTDEFGVKYSKDRKRLLETPEFKDEHSYSDQWLASMYTIENLKTIDKIQMDSMQRALLTHDNIKKCKEYKLPPKIIDYIIKEGTLIVCDNAFTNCSGLIKVEMTNSLVRIGKNVFDGCDNLEMIIIPKGTIKKFEQLLPKYKDKLNEKDIENSLSTEVTKEDLAHVWTDGYGVKYSSDKRRLLKAPNDLKDYTIIDGTDVICDKAFFECKDLEAVRFPKNIRMIGDFAFYNCVKLREAATPQNTKFGMCVFEGCERLSHYHPFE